MGQIPEHLSPQMWLNQVFSSGEAMKGGVVKRQIRDVERLVGRDLFAAELRRRGYRSVENGRHFVIFCNGKPIRVVR